MRTASWCFRDSAFRLAICALFLVAVGGGCAKTPPIVEPDVNRPLPPGAFGLRRIADPAEIPDFTRAFDRREGLRQAVSRSLSYLSKPSSQQFFPSASITHARAVASLIAFAELLETNASPAELNRLVRERFDVYTSVGYDDAGTVRFTGYFTPIFNASRTPDGTFRYPIYGLPEGARLTDEGTVALAGISRRAIEQNNMLTGKDLFYLADPFEPYIIQTQGSGVLRLVGGGTTQVGFAGTNGLGYRSVREAMMRDGVIGKTDGLAAMMAYFKAHPEQLQPYTWKNPRYAFLRETSGYPRGSLNEPVTPLRTIATDKSIFPRACLAVVDLPPSEDRPEPWQQIMLDQDTGGAIRAAGRCDIYLGVGPQAGQRAGELVRDGRLYYLFLKRGPAAGGHGWE